MSRADGFSVFAVVAIGGLVALAVAYLYLFDASEDAVKRSMRYDVSWIGANGRIEAANLEKYAARLVASGEKADADAVRLYYQIILSRLDTWGSGGFRRFIDLLPERRERFEDLRAKILALASAIENLEQAGAQQQVLEGLAAATPIIERIGAQAHTTAVEEATQVRDELREKQLQQRWLMMALMIGGAISLVILIFQNRSLREAHLVLTGNARDLTFLARHDPLTKLANRLAFDEALGAVLASKQEQETVAVLAIDLDDFKRINDTLGHAAGDALLVAISDVFRALVSASDPRNLIARIGGNEFRILLCLQPGDVTALDMARQFMTRLEDPVETAYGSIMIGASVGVSESAGATAPKGEELIVDADLALTDAKAGGKGIALQFDPQMRTVMQRRLRIEAALSEAIANSQIFPHYQMQIDLASGQPIGAEALARWRHPELGWVPPDEFIPIAESNGDVVALGRAMLEAACRDARSFPDNLKVSVNLSIVQMLRNDVVAMVADVLASTGLEPARLTLEVTESAMMSDLDKVLLVLRRLRKLGVTIALDDFGTGYSALAYLTRFDWDELKIDRSFIKSAVANSINLTIIRTIRILAGKMQAKVTVEGVETREQHDLLKRIGCHTGQGYLFGRPMPAAELIAAISRHSCGGASGTANRTPVIADSY